MSELQNLIAEYRRWFSDYNREVRIIAVVLALLFIGIGVVTGYGAYAVVGVALFLWGMYLTYSDMAKRNRRAADALEAYSRVGRVVHPTTEEGLIMPLPVGWELFGHTEEGLPVIAKPAIEVIDPENNVRDVLLVAQYSSKSRKRRVHVSSTLFLTNYVSDESNIPVSIGFNGHDTVRQKYDWAVWSDPDQRHSIIEPPIRLLGRVIFDALAQSTYLEVRLENSDPPIRAIFNTLDYGILAETAKFPMAQSEFILRGGSKGQYVTLFPRT